MKRLIGILLSLLLLLTVLPVPASADYTVDVSFTLTQGEGLYASDGVLLAQQTLQVPYFDLSQYGLQDYYYNPDCYTASEQQPGTAQTAEGKVTLLHLLLFATEVYRCGLSAGDAGKGYLADSGMMRDELSLEGRAGSSYMTLWNLGTNFNYFVNNVMPIGRSGWMATSDQIVLHSGDSVRVHGITGTAGGTNLRILQAGEQTDAALAADETVRLTLTHCAMQLDGQAPVKTPLANEAIYASRVNSTGTDVRAWQCIGTTGADGALTCSASTLGVGDWILASAGSSDSKTGMQNAPAVCRLAVQGKAPDAENVPVTIEGLHPLQLNYVKLYTFTDAVKGTRDLLDGTPPAADGYYLKYDLSLLPGDYWVDGYDADGRCNGGLAISVRKDGGNTFCVQRVYDLHATNTDWVQDADYAIYVSVTSADGKVNRHVKTGLALDGETLRTACLFLKGDTVKASFVPLGEKAAQYVPAVLSRSLTLNCSVTSPIYEAAVFTFTAPAGAVISAGRFSDYYLYNFYTPQTETVLPDGRVQSTFRLPQERTSGTNGASFFVRVQHPQGVTYWDFIDPQKSERDMEITASQLYLDNAQIGPSTVLQNFEYNTYDKADVYLNGTVSGCVTMRKGGTFALNAFRNWMAIENFYNNKVALPDMHYRVIDENGRDSDLLTVTPDARNSGKATVTANGSGTAILLVTYDAMFSTKAYVSGKANQPNLFSAIWPENTGVLVFRIGDTDGTIDTGMTLHGEGAMNALDAEHDPLFYDTDDGASYTFTPESGCTVTINRPIVTDSMTFGGFTADGVQTHADGSVTLTGLLQGRNIVKLEKNGRVTYQVITARHITYTITDESGSVPAPGSLHAGDTVYIQFAGLVNPVEKMSGVYNHNARICFTGEDGTVFTSDAGGAFGVYDFSGNPVRQKLAVTIPPYFTGGSYTLGDGCIAMRISGSAPGAHRGVSYDNGMDPNFSAGTSGALQGVIPSITLQLAPSSFCSVQLHITDTDGNAVDPAGLTIRVLDADGAAVPVQPDGTLLLPAGEYAYTIGGDRWEEAQGAFTVPESDGTQTVDVTLQAIPPQKTTFREKLLSFLQTVWLFLTKPVRFVRELIRKLREKIGK